MNSKEEDRPKSEIGAADSVRILVVDDHPAVLEGLSLLVTPLGMQIFAKVTGLDEALDRLRDSRPDLAIVDLSLENEDGTKLVSELKLRGVPVLVYSMYCDTRHVERAFGAGALGYVTKLEFHEILLQAIRSVSSGKRFVSPKAAAALTSLLDKSQAGTTDDLSQREKQVFLLLGQGEGTHEIAVRMNLSTHTVESYYARIQLKHGIESRQELRRAAIISFHSHPA